MRPHTIAERIALYAAQGANDAVEAYDPREGEPPSVGDLATDYLADGWHFEGELDASRDMLRAFAAAWAEGWHNSASRIFAAHEAAQEFEND